MDCLFCKIVKGEIKAKVLFSDEEMVAFQDIHPQAPTHLLIIPKKHIATIDETCKNDDGLLGRMILKAKALALEAGLTKGYRLVLNVNPEGGQEIYHIHLHLLGGRQMTWPPG